MHGDTYDFSWRMDAAGSGLIVRNSMGGSPFSYVIGFDTGGDSPRQVLVAENDPKFVVWNIVAAV
jgi:hypothetical protein